VVGNPRQLPRHCLHLFVPAKSNPVGGNDGHELHMRRDLCGTGGMDAQEAKIYVPGSLTTVVKIKTAGDRGYADGSEWGHNLTKNAAKADGQ